MLIDSPIFPGSLGRNFVGRKLGIISNACIYVQGDVNLWVAVSYPLKPRILVNPQTMMIPHLPSYIIKQKISIISIK